MQKRVYISSTYKDLVPYRNAIKDMFQYKGLQDDFTLVSMEGYVSEAGKRALDVCLQDVRNADIYILILAKRYGSIVEETGISYTEMEYNEAKNMADANPLYKIFVFWSKEENEKDDFEAVKELENPALGAFYSKALDENASFIHPFTTPDNLCKQILLTFNYNFKKPDSLNDYKEALLLLNREAKSYNFSRSVRKNTNSFFFSSLYGNNPNDFIERIYDMEMGGRYNKCNIELGQFTTINPDKFRDTFIAQLYAQWGKEMDTFEFQDTDKLFLSIEINSEQIKSESKLENLYKVLTNFLPQYLCKEGLNCTDRIFFIYYSYIESEKTSIENFETFVKKLTQSLNIAGCLANMDQLNDVTKTDAKIWLTNFIKNHTFDQADIDDLLEIEDNPFKTFKMREVNKLLKGWIKNNVLNK